MFGVICKAYNFFHSFPHYYSTIISTHTSKLIPSQVRLTPAQTKTLIKPLPERGLLLRRLKEEKSKLNEQLAYGLSEFDLPPEDRQNSDLRLLLSGQFASTTEKYAVLKRKLMAYYARRDNDTGSPEVQIAALTVDLDQLSQHTQGHSHDHTAKRKAVMIVFQRRRLLKYLRKIDLHRYYCMLEELDLARDYLEKLENKYVYYGQEYKLKVHRTVRGGGNFVQIIR